MTSMIDVVFLLLIFFITTTAFVKTERELNPAIKVKSDSAPQQQIQLDPAEVRVERNQAGQMVYRLGGSEFRSVERLAQRLRVSFSQEQKIEQGAFVHVSDEAPFAMAAGAIQACKSAGFIGVSYVPIPSK